MNTSLWQLLVVWIAFILFFVVGNIVIRDVISYIGDIHFSKIIKLESSTVIRVIYSMTGVFAFYMGVHYLLSKGVTVSQPVVDFNSQCFGIYIFQQFVLMALYFYTPLPTLLGLYVLPWFGFIAAFIVSYILTRLIRSTSFGRKFI